MATFQLEKQRLKRGGKNAAPGANKKNRYRLKETKELCFS